MSNIVVIQQPQKMYGVNQSNQWTTGICDCCEDLPSCCFAFWCFPCFACKTAKDFGECLCLPLLDFSGIVPPITMAMRVGARHRYGIEGTMCKDCLYATFCPWCSWCQISREMKMRNEQIILVNANSGPVPTRRM